MALWRCFRSTTKLTLEQRFLEQRVSRVEGVVEQINERLGSIDRRLDNMERRIDGLDQKIDGLAQRMDDQKSELTHRMDSHLHWVLGGMFAMWVTLAATIVGLAFR